MSTERFKRRGQHRFELTSGISGDKLGHFLGSQTLWLGSNARLLVNGTFKPTSSRADLVTGQVLNGGSVS
ncbi:MAG: hypothetical protein U1F34_07070 [Gammaproteobacteria bacterium]